MGREGGRPGWEGLGRPGQQGGKHALHEVGTGFNRPSVNPRARRRHRPLKGIEGTAWGGEARGSGGPALGDWLRLGGRAGYQCLGAPPSQASTPSTWQACHVHTLISHTPVHPTTRHHPHRHRQSFPRPSHPHTPHLPPQTQTRLPQPAGLSHAGPWPTGTLPTGSHTCKCTHTNECSDSPDPHSPPRALM